MHREHFAWAAVIYPLATVVAGYLYPCSCSCSWPARSTLCRRAREGLARRKNSSASLDPRSVLNLFREVETELSSKPILLQPLRVHICGFPLDYVIIDLPPPTIPASEKGAGLRVIRGTVHAVA